jgi:microsomal prostaglandin-E synthase 2
MLGRLGGHRIVSASLVGSVFGSNFIKKESFCAASETAAITPSHVTIADVTIYQYKICPFCHKVKALLDYLDVDYKTVEVNPISKAQIKKLGDFKKVPVAVINGETVADSDVIIEAIRQKVESSKQTETKMRMNSLYSGNDTTKWVTWCESRLAVMLYPNITRNLGESWKAFEYCGDVESWSATDRISNRYLGPVAMLFANGKIKKKYDIKDERAELKTVIDEWLAALNESGGKGPFLHGESISMADLCVFGVLRSISGLPTFNEVMTMSHEGKALSAWYAHVQKAVDQK